MTTTLHITDARHLHIKRKLILVIIAALAIPIANAKEYGNYDLKRLLTVTETPSGKKYGFDGAYLDQILNDLSAHAKNYPPQFDTPQDQQRATQDVKTLSGMLDTLITLPRPTSSFLSAPDTSIALAII